jgi:FMN reductase
MKYLVLSCSLNPKSRSRDLARVVHGELEAQGHPVRFLDLQDFPLPLCDGATAYADPNVAKLRDQIDAARGIVLATGIYNYDVNAAAKNMVELTGRAWNDKVVGFVCAAGGHGSYMSLMPFANSLMLDFRCLVIPRFVYAPDTDPEDETFGSEAIRRRSEDLASELARVTDGLFPTTDDE